MSIIGGLFMAWKGPDEDQGIYYSSSADGVNWTPQAIVSGVGTSSGPSIASFSNKLFIAWKGPDYDEDNTLVRSTAVPRLHMIMLKI